MRLIQYKQTNNKKTHNLKQAQWRQCHLRRYMYEKKKQINKFNNRIKHARVYISKKSMC